MLPNVGKAKEHLSMLRGRPPADCLHAINVKLKGFAKEIISFNICKDSLDSWRGFTAKHVKHNANVRALFCERGSMPEQLPPAEDLKKIERRHAAEAKSCNRVWGFWMLSQFKNSRLIPKKFMSLGVDDAKLRTAI